MSNVNKVVSKEDKDVEKRLKELYECTRQEGFVHIRNMFNQKISELKSIDGLTSYSGAELEKALSIHFEVAERLKEILNQIDSEVDLHTTQTVDEVRIYGAGDFGG